MQSWMPLLALMSRTNVNFIVEPAYYVSMTTACPKVAVFHFVGESIPVNWNTETSTLCEKLYFWADLLQLCCVVIQFNVLDL